MAAEVCMVGAPTLELAPEDPRTLGLRKDFAAAAAAAAAADGFRGEGGTLVPGCPTTDGTEGVVEGGLRS